MNGHPAFARRAGAALVLATSACAGLPSSRTDASATDAPPRSWDAAVTFIFSDSLVSPYVDHAMVIEFHDGVRQRVVTARDLGPGRPNTPWYRVRPGRGGSTAVFRVTLEHAGGARTTAEHLITIAPDEFVRILVGVYTRDPNGVSLGMFQQRKSYPLHPDARARPGDSLWIEHGTRDRRCLNCPS